MAADGAHRGARLQPLPADGARAAPPPAARTRARSWPTCPRCGPSWFFAVPRIWEKLKAAIEAGVAAEQDAERKQATEWALDVGLRKVRAEQAGEEVPPELAEEHAKADALVLSKIRERLGLDQAESVNVGRGAHAARGDRVLPRDRRAAGRALGHVRDLRLRHLQPAGQDQDRDGGPGIARRRDQARRRRRGADARPRGHDRLPQPAGEDAARRSTPTAGSTPATWASSTRRATSRSSTARRS